MHAKSTLMTADITVWTALEPTSAKRTPFILARGHRQFIKVGKEAGVAREPDAPQ